MIFDLVHDFADVLDAMPEGHPRRRILKLLDEAIRRDVHFIDRHPTTLFQCMWNTCWWYDCPEAGPKGHYPRRMRITFPLNLDPEYLERTSSHCVSETMELWRSRRDAARPWLRSLRPPRVPLNSGLIGTLRQSHSAVTDVICLRRGRSLVGGSRDGTITLWHFETGAALARITLDEASPVCLTLSRDDTQLAVGTDRGEVLFLDPASLQVHGRMSAHEGEVKQIAFTSDGDHLVTGGADGMIRVWDANHLVSVNTVRLLHSEYMAFAVSPMEPRIAFADSLELKGGTPRQFGMRLWDFVRDEEIWTTGLSKSGEPVQIGPIKSIAFSSSGQFVLSLSDDCLRDVGCWDARDGTHFARIRNRRTVQYYQPGGFGRTRADLINRFDDLDGLTLTALAISADETMVVAGFANGGIRRWTLGGGTYSELPTLSGHSKAVTSVQFLPDDSQLVSGSADGTICIWDRHGDGQRSTASDREGRIEQLRFVAPCSDYVATVSSTGRIGFWDVSRGSCIAMHRTVGWVKCLCFTQDGAFAAAGLDDGTVRLFRTADGMLLWERKDHEDAIAVLKFSRDGAHLFAADRWIPRGLIPESWTARRHSIRGWRVGTAEPILALEPPVVSIRDFDVSPDLTRIVVDAFGDSEARPTEFIQSLCLYDAVNGEEIAVLRSDRECPVFYDPVISEDGTRVFACRDASSARAWDTRTGTELGPCKDHGVAAGMELLSHADSIQVCPPDMLFLNDALGLPAAWWPVQLTLTQRHSSQPLFVGADGERLVILKLEDSAPSEARH